MATYQELRTRSQQVRDEQNIGGNTALRVGQLLMDIVKYFYDNDEAANEYLQQHFAMVNDGTQLLNWQQSPIVLLQTMGADYDDGDPSALSQGENYFNRMGDYIMEADGHGGGINGETPKANVLYVNLANDTLYTWNGASFDAITSGGGGGSISGDDILKNAYYLNGNLVLVFETESGDKTVSIPVNFDASNYVPTSRTVNGKALSNNITLSQSNIPGLVAALAAKVGYSDDEWLQVKAGAMQAASAVPNTTTVNGKRLNNNIVIGMADIPGLLQAIANAGSGAVSVTTNQDGTFTIHSGDNDYTINLNHTHENMAKLIVCEESDLPSTLDNSTIYAITDSGETEIEKLIIRGMEFAGGGVPAGTPAITKPSGTTINLGENSGSGVSKSIEIKANSHITGDLTVGLAANSDLSFDTTNLPSGVTYNSGAGTLTIAQATAMQGVNITIVYSGSGEAEIEGGIVISGGGLLSPKSVVVVVVQKLPEDCVDNSAWNASSGEQFSAPEPQQGYLTTKFYPMAHDANHRFDITIKSGFVTPTDLERGMFVAKKAITDEMTNSAFLQNSNPRRKVGTDAINEHLYNYVSATLKKSELADCYVYDNIAGTYLFAGSNVNTLIPPVDNPS